jgi:hypothetical protein
MRCDKCQMVRDEEDAFCRKCGAMLAHEGAYDEVLGVEANSETEVQIVEVLQPQAANLPATVEKQRVHNYLQIVVRALNSETGKKLVKGATMVALSVAAEIATQAATRHNNNRALSHPSKKVASNSPTIYSSAESLPDGVVEHYSYYYERLIVKRITREKQ